MSFLQQLELETVCKKRLGKRNIFSMEIRCFSHLVFLDLNNLKILLYYNSRVLRSYLCRDNCSVCFGKFTSLKFNPVFCASRLMKKSMYNYSTWFQCFGTSQHQRSWVVIFHLKGYSESNLLAVAEISYLYSCNYGALVSSYEEGPYNNQNSNFYFPNPYAN